MKRWVATARWRAGITGVRGWSALFLLGIVDIVIAINLFRLKTAAWWTAVAVVVFRTVSSAMTFARENPMQIYSGSGMTEEQLRVLRSNPMLQGHMMFWWTLVWTLVFLAYLVWLKRYFKTPEAPAQREPVLSILAG